MMAVMGAVIWGFSLHFQLKLREKYRSVCFDETTAQESLDRLERHAVPCQRDEEGRCCYAFQEREKLELVSP